MDSSFTGFDKKDFLGVKGTSWRKRLGMKMEGHLSTNFKEKFYRRIPYLRKTVYWGTQPLFKEKTMRYCYSALFLSLDKDYMDIGLKVEKGFEEGEDFGKNSREEVLMTASPSYWDWYRMEQNLDEKEFCNNIDDSLNSGYNIDLFISGKCQEPLDLRDSYGLKRVIDNWKNIGKYKNTWGDLLLYKRYPRDMVLDMNGEEITKEAIDIFNDIKVIYDNIKRI